MQYKLNEKIQITVNRAESNFDRACDEAYSLACSRFGLDDCGYFDRVDKSDRSLHSIEVEFESYRHTGNMAGQRHIYVFRAWVG